MLTTGLLVAAPSALAQQEGDGPGAECHSYIRAYFDDNNPVRLPGDDVGFRLYGATSANDLYVRAYWQDRSDGSYVGPVYENVPLASSDVGDDCHWSGTDYWNDYNARAQAPLEPGTYDLVAVQKGYDWPTPTNYDQRDRTSLLTVEVPELAVSNDVPSEVEIGETFTATATVENVASHLSAPDVDLSQTITGAQTLDDAQISATELDPGESLTVSYDARATEIGTLDVATAATSQVTADVQVGDRASSSITAIGPDIAMDREMPDAVNSGEVFQVNVTYTNTGALAASDVDLSDTFDSAYTPVPNGLNAEEPEAEDPPEEPPEEPPDAPSAPSTPGQPGSVSPPTAHTDAFTYGTPAADQNADPVTVRGEETTTFTWGVDQLAPGESIEVSYTLVAPAHLPVVSVDEPDQPEPPEEPPEEPPVDELPVLPPEDPEPPAGPVTVADNDGSYVFTSEAGYSANGYGLSGSADADQTVRALHNTFVEEPDPEDVEPPEEPPEPPEQP